MSMNAQFREITQSLLGLIKANPALASSVALGDSGLAGKPSAVDMAMRLVPKEHAEEFKAAFENLPPDFRAEMEASAARAADLMKQELASLKEQAGGVEVPPEELGESLNLDKAWHGLHYLLCGTAQEGTPPLGNAVLGGTPIGDNLAYGPVRFLEAADVAAVATALSSLDSKEVGQRFDPARMNEANVYPTCWDDPDTQEWLMESFDALREFYAGVSERGNAVLLFLT
jgi:hypothetical protein